jgi:peptidoglycan-associated lipoprotein
MMKKQVFRRLVFALMVVGLVFTVACAKKQVVSEPQGAALEGAIDPDAAAKAAALAKQRAMEEAMLREKALKEAALKDAEFARQAAARTRFTTQNIHFAFDSSELNPMSRTLLKEKALWLGENAGVTVVIEGHCDDRGTMEYNLALGDRRAFSVKKFLVDLGIAESRLSTISYGEERPLDTANNETAWAKNRRAQFVIK